MNIKSKIVSAKHLKPEEREIVSVIDDGKAHDVVLTTNGLAKKMDSRDKRYIWALENVRMVFRVKKGGCLVVVGNIGCSYSNPFSCEFFVKRAYKDEKVEFSDIRGVHAEVEFGNYPTDNRGTKEFLAQLADNPDFVFNLSQFDEFMELFNFYKTLSNELNNNVTYEVESISDAYFFVPIDVKGIEVEAANQMTNDNGIVCGHRIEKYKFERLSSEQKEQVQKIVDVRISEKESVIGKLRKFADCLFLSDDKIIDEAKARSLNTLDIINITKGKDCLILSGRVRSYDKAKYLNLYDVGQKIKLESIDNSLRLIRQGATGAAAELLEYIIGKREMPTKSARASQSKNKYTKNLDVSQKKAFLMATDGSPVSLIKGPPGTGKTHVINAIIQYITKELKEKVIVSSQTHVAIDNVLDKLMENFDLIIPNRITNRANKYSGEEIDRTLYKTWARKFFEHNKLAGNIKLATLIASDMTGFKGDERFRYSEEVSVSDYSVIGVTTTSSQIGGSKGLELLRDYKWLIIDEVSKCPITEVLRYLPYVENIIMVGDDFQLAPLLEFTEEEVKGLPSYNKDLYDKLKKVYEESVFATTLSKARDCGRLAELAENYRSVKSVLGAYNIFYGGSLKNMREAVNPQKVRFARKFPILDDRDIFFVDVKNGKEDKDGTSRYNVEELTATAQVLEDLIANVINPLTVTVSAIFPYAAQISKFQKQYRELINKAKKTFKCFEIDTVDAFQGKESDIVLVNTVVTDASQRNFLNDFRRINVSMSRARDKLFVFGNPITLSKIEMQTTDGNKRKYFKDIIDDIRRYGAIITFEGGINYEFTSKCQIEID